MSARTRPGLLRPLRPLLAATRFVRDLASGPEALEALEARGLVDAPFLSDPRRAFRRTHECSWKRPTPRQARASPFLGRWDPGLSATRSPWAAAPRALVRQSCALCAAPPDATPSRRLARLLVATGAALTVEELAREFARRLRDFAVRENGGLDLRNYVDWSHLATERVVWRLVRREAWRPAFYRYQGYDPRRPIISMNLHAPYVAAFDRVWANRQPPAWVRAWEAWVRTGGLTRGERILRASNAILGAMRSVGTTATVAAESAVLGATLPAETFLDRVRVYGETRHGLTIQAESLVATAARAARVWPTMSLATADPFEPLRRIHALGFAVHDVTPDAIELVCPLPARPRPRVFVSGGVPNLPDSGLILTGSKPAR